MTNLVSFFIALIHFFKSLNNYTLETIAKIFRAVPVEGALDDLMGQQLVILLCLFIISLSVILLFIIYFLLNIFIKNQEYVLSKFNNRFIKLYIKYQIALAKIATIHIPITIVIGLLVLIHGLHFLITHPIPLENLGMDLHSFISSKK